MNIEKLQRAWRHFQKYRLQKIHLDWIISILSIPVLITAIIINWGNLSHKPMPVTIPSASPSPQVIVLPTSSPSCTKSIGPISISYPTEGQSVNDNPVCITISYPDTSYCSVVWSYRINNGSWSDFSNNTPCLYNLPNGTTQFDLRVNSTVSSSTTTLSRSFVYTGSNTIPTPTPTSVPTSTPTPVATSSAQ